MIAPYLPSGFYDCDGSADVHSTKAFLYFPLPPAFGQGLVSVLVTM